MSDFELRDAVARLEEVIEQEDTTLRAVSEALEAVRQARAFDNETEDLIDMLALLYRLIGAGGEHALLSRFGAQMPPDPWVARVSYAAKRLIETVFYEEDRDTRLWRNDQYHYALAMGREVGSGYPDEVTHPPHVPFSYQQASAQALPYLGYLEKVMVAQPFAHYQLCWNVLQSPIRPFDRVFREWLKSLDARDLGVTPHLKSIDHALGLKALGDRGRQMFRWREIEDMFLSSLKSAHPLVAGAAARVVGTVYGDVVHERIIEGALWSLDKVLRYLAALPRNRRRAAGGFLDGFGDCEDPLALITEKAPEFPLKEWVLDVLALGEEEPYLPAAQTFWFYVHEYFWNDPEFAYRLIEAGHEWVAYMCATEGPLAESAMRSVLETLARSEDHAIAEGAHAALARA